VRISPVGRFDFNSHRDFREAYQKHGPSVHYLIDMRATDYIDSSALGMLLLLREHAGGEKSRITIANPRPEVRSIFSVANFEKLFAIE
jgi:anti-anti-sigma factor